MGFIEVAEQVCGQEQRSLVEVSGELYTAVGTDSVGSPRQGGQIRDQVGADQQILEMM